MATVLVLTCVSCGSEQDGMDYKDDFLYTLWRGVLYRISTVSASVTPVCPDPLCNHSDEKCPFYDVSENGIRIVGKYIYYLKDSTRFEYMRKLCRFDIENGEFEVLYEPENGTIADWLVTDDYIYFNLAYINEKMQSSFDIYRYTIESGNLKTLTDEPLRDIQWPYAFKDGRVFWADHVTEAVYSTDKDFQDRKDGDKWYTSNQSMGSYAFQEERSGFDQNSFTDLFRITRVDTVTGEEKIVFDELGCFPILYNNKIIYSKLDDPKLLGYMYNEDSGKLEPYYDKWGGKYYICNTDGSNERLLCDISDTGCAIPILSGIQGGKNGVGDWIAVLAHHYAAVSTDGNKSVIEYDGSVYLLINIQTGEIKTAAFEGRAY